MDTHDYDVVVIGAGPGGLTTAAYLSKAGRRVLVIDARGRVGGHMSAFTDGGYEFDIGLHYTSEPAVQGVLRPLRVDVRFREFDPKAMFHLSGPAGDLDVPRGLEAFRFRLDEAFPAERETIRTFLDTLDLLATELQQIPQRPHLRELPQLPWRLRGLLRYGSSTVGDYLDGLHASPALKTALLSWTTGSIGVQPSRLSFPVAAALVRLYLDGLSYPQGGSRVISEGLAEVVRRHGGEVRLGTETAGILVGRNRVRGVLLRGSDVEAAPEPTYEVSAPVVVSAVDIKQTYLELLPPDAVPTRMTRRVRNYDLPLPLAVVYVVLDRDLGAEGYSNTTQIIGETTDIDGMYATMRAGLLPQAGSCGVWNGSLADPENGRVCRPGQTNLQLVGLAPAHHSWWGAAPGSGPTPRYAARKRELRDHFVRLAEQVIPGFSRAIVYEETATPITEERLMRCSGGTSYGPALTPRQVFTRLGPTSPIEGLFHAGAGARPSHGLVGTLEGGLATAAAITRMPVAELQTTGETRETVQTG